MVIISCPNNQVPQADLAGPLINKRDYSHAYRAIRQSSRSSPSFSATTSSAVLILVSPDVDALAATRILTTLLIEDDIPHRIVPVEGYRSLLKVLRDDVQGHDELRSIVLINLGSVLSLPTTVPLPPDCIIHVIDSHRPWNLENLFATSDINQRIWIWDDGEIEGRMSRSGGEKDAFERLEFEIIQDGEDSESDRESNVSDDPSDQEDTDDDDRDQDQDSVGSDDNSSADEPHSLRRKRKRSRDAGSDQGRPSGRKKLRGRKKSKDHQKNPDGDDDDQSETDRKPHRPQLSEMERSRLRMVLTRYYNRGTVHGMSSAGVMYLLAARLGRSDRELLWLAIVGLTAQMLTSSIDMETYEAYGAAYASEAIAIDSNATASILDPWTSEDMSTTTNGSATATAANMANTKVNADDRSIRVVPDELRLTLYRHWSLETSLYHTGYVASKLGIWREKGMQKLSGLLAKMGFSLASCRQSYYHMPIDLRRTLVSRLQSIAPEYGLTELTFRSFVRSVGYRTAPLSASDVVQGCSALLVAAHGVRIEVETPGMGFGGISSSASSSSSSTNPLSSELFTSRKLWTLGNPLPSTVVTSSSSSNANGLDSTSTLVDDDQQPNQKSLIEADRIKTEAWVTNFYEAYRSLDPKRSSSIDLLRSSLFLSQSLHRTIVQRGISLITNQSIRTLKNFRFAILNDGPDLDLFTHVEILDQLARWLVDSLRDIVLQQESKTRHHHRKEAGGGGSEMVGMKPLPFLLAALDNSRDTFLVLGQTGSPSFGYIEPNQFGLAFQQAASVSNSRVRHDRFHTSAIEVRVSDLSKFIENVHLKL